VIKKEHRRDDEPGEESGDNDRRATSDRDRASRLTMATVSTPLGVAFGVVVVEVLKQSLEMHVTNIMFYAISAICGSLVTTASLCAHDFRSIALKLIYRRRKEDK